jgi:hypothetical protein
LKSSKDFKLNVFLVVFSIAVTLVTYRPIFSGQLIGDPFDSRLMIVIHEHWWRWVNGLTEFRDLGFFYPYNKALGFSDAFLLPGVIYSIFRFLNFGLAESWIFATFIILIIGNIGWVVIAKKFLKSNIIRILFVATIISSFSFTAYFSINPNIVGYSLVSWFALLMYSIEREKNSFQKQRKIALFIILLEVYALSYWYGAFFIGLIVLVGMLTRLFYDQNRQTFKNLSLEFKKYDKSWIITIPVILFLVWLFYYIYISIVGEPFRSKPEMILNSPTPLMLLNAGSPDQYGLKNITFEKFYQFLGFKSAFENTIGLGLAVTLFGIISFVYFTRSAKRNIKIWLISLIIIFFYFAKLVNDVSLHSFLFDLVPGINSIRYPARFIIILGFGFIFTSFKLIDNQIRSKKSNIVKVSLILISFVLLLDQIRAPFIGWDKKLLVNKNLFSQAKEIKSDCDYFYFHQPGGWWYSQIEAIVFSTQIGLPTVNGYSGAFPQNYPTQSWNSNSGSNEILAWISEIGTKEKGCFISDIGNFEHLVTDKTYVDFVGFTPSESNREVSWNWAVNINPYLYVFSAEKKYVSVSFEVESSNCFENQVITIEEAPSGKILKRIQVNSRQKVELDLDFRDVYSKRIQFSTDADVCRIEGDPRGLYFNVKNLKYQVYG